MNSKSMSYGNGSKIMIRKAKSCQQAF